MFDLLKGFPCQWSTKSSVNSILFKELNPPRKCRANVHCTDLELKWSAAIANIHRTTHLFPLTISRDTLSTLSTPQSRATLSQPLRSISPPSGHCKSSQIIPQDQSHTRTLAMQTLTLSLSSIGQPVIINHYSTLTIPNTSRREKTQVSTIYYLPNFHPLDISRAEKRGWAQVWA